MSNGKNPLMLMMALAMPGAASALGLGEIHVDSGLNERFAAEIDIVGATADDLIDLRAAVANRETFLRYGADRPAFLASATFKVAADSQGHPVLAVRSTDAFTEPLVNFLVDLRWHRSEIVREYTLLLDPPGFGPATRVAQADRSAAADTSVAPVAPVAPVAARSQAIPVPESRPQTGARRFNPSGAEPIPASAHLGVPMTQLKVGAKATLRGIAWRVGARSESDLKRMMIAIFRANPSAFDGNINRLYLGAMLTIPSDAAVAAISNIEAKREFHAQMAAWRGAGKKFAANGAVPTAPFANAPVPVPAAAVSGAAVPTAAAPAPAVSQHAASTAAAAAVAATAAAGSDADPDDADALNRKVQSLEKELSEVKGQIDSDQDKIVVLREQAQRAADPAPIAAAQPGSKPEQASLVPVVAGLGVLAALAGLYWRIRRRARQVSQAQLDIPSYRDAPVPVVPVPVPVRMNAAPIIENSGMTVEHTVYEEPEAGHSDAPESSVDQDPADSQVHTTAAATQASSEAGGSSTAISFYDADTQALPMPGPIDPTQPKLPIMPPSAAKRVSHATATMSRPDTGETTVNMRLDGTRIESTRVEPPRLDYNLLDLDMTAAQHVQMPSELHEHVVVKERRRNIADVLKLAIEREPDRHDLRMKLLEFYYSNAATNRQGFLETVQKFAREREQLEPEVWEKIAFMGRQIAADNPLFAETPAADDLADCA